MALLGEIAVLVSLVFCVWGGVSAWRAGQTRDASLETSARRAAILTQKISAASVESSPSNDIMIAMSSSNRRGEARLTR